MSAWLPERFPGEGGREGGAAVTGTTTIWETVTLAGSAERTRVARAFVAAVLDPGYPCADDAVLLVSEIFDNGVRHSRSDAPGETITVAVKVMDSVVRVRSLTGADPAYQS